MAIINGTSGNDTINGTNGDDVIYAGAGDDWVHTKKGNDIVYGGDGNDELRGDSGNDTLYGENGNDTLTSSGGNDYLVGGAGYDYIDGGDGTDTARYFGSILEYDFYNMGGGAWGVVDHVAARDGSDYVIRVERLQFADVTIDLTTNNAPIAQDDSASTDEDVGTYSSGSGKVTSNDFDWEGNTLTVTPGTFNGTYGTLTLNADGTYTYTPYASTQSLALGQNVQDSFSYTVSDGSLSDTGTLTITISGRNDAPVANPDAATAGENQVISVNVLANDSDVDNGAVLTVTAASAPVGKGSATVVGNQVQFNPGTAFDHLAQGATEQVVLSYTITDEHGATSSSTVTVTVTGTNDGPVANADTAAGTENQVLTIDALANDTDVDDGAVKTLVAASAPAGKGTASIVGNQVQFDPGTAFDHLAQGATEVVVLSYTMQDEHGATSGSTISITVTGTNDGPVANADTASTSENASVTVNVLGNDTDVDDGAVLTVTAASAPAGKGSASVVGNQVRFDPGTAFDHLAQGASEVVVVSYTVQDEHGGTSSSTVSITVTGTNDGPVANPDTAAGTENQILTIDALANDTDADDGAVKSLVSVSTPAGKGSASIVGNQVRFDPGTAFDHLAQGATEVVVLSYSMQDEHGATSSSTISVTVTGTNDGPVANADVASTGENGTVTVNVLANDTDVDDGAVLTVTAASAPVGKGSASVVGNQVQFNPGTAFDHLAVGESEVVVVSYSIQDQQGATSSSTVTITVTGTNDGPVANPDSRTTSENSAVVIDVLANDHDVDHDAVLVVTAASGPAGQGTVSIVENQVRFDPGTDFDYLAEGESAVVVLSYTIEDEHGASATSTVTITVQGRDEGSNSTGTDESETLIGTTGDDTINALGGDDTVFGLAGDDLIYGGNGNDFLNGEDDNDVIEGGNGEDVLSGGDGNDQLSGQAGSDNLSGENGDDQLSGGDGFDQLYGDAGNDVIAGGNDDDILAGGDGNDQLSGQAGNDSLDGGEGDDTLDGGDGDDFLSDFAGTNSFVGGAGGDQIVASSTDGAQTIDGGDGNDTIRHYYRSSASTITTGSGSDTIELAHADVGSAAIVVTDFTAGAGGDMFRLSGDDGSLLSLLSGWDGSSNPFGSGFLRLQQSGADTLLQWDRDGAAGGSNWETLAVFQNTDADDFTDANFVPGYDPDGSAPAGQTITGTAGDDVLTGTIGADTIDGLSGNDVVNSGAGADLIHGGDGFDQLYGEADDDIIEGGNDDDILSGGDGNDQLSGQAGNDGLVGENGDDQLSGAAGNDSLDGGEGDDGLDGGDGDDFLSDFAGTNSFAGGAGGDQIVASSSDGAQTIDGGDGNDTIRHYYRSSASTITTGSGSDTIELAHADVGSAAIIVTDFMAGAGGDILRLSGDDGALLSLLSGWDGSSNPFGSGFLRLQQSGADTLLQWDRDGTAGGSNWETLAVFQNTDADDFTEANFVPGYDPDGSAPAGQTITGTAGDDTLIGTIGDDTIDGLGGNDVVNAGAGADLIHGGDGFDQLYGEADDDVLEGGNDDDILAGGDGNDQLSGQAGNDGLVGENGDDQLSGGADNDSLDGGEGEDTLDGGDGDDFLSDFAGTNSFAGGAGGDQIVASSSDGAQTIDGGDGNDTIRHYYRSSASTITTGSGSDTIELAHADVGSAAIIVTDFTAGTGGDMFRLSGDDGSLLSLLSGWDGSSNPFGSGFLRLEQSGADTLLQWDRDGTAGGSNWETLAVLQNTDADDFTDANFVPGYDPNGSAPAGETITGTAEDDTLTGTVGGDTINGLGGNDVVNGGAGADLIDGGDGFDILYGEADDDVIDGGNNDDYAWGGEGADQMSGGTGNDGLFGENGDDQLSGGDGDDSLEGSEGDDTLVGGDGQDFLTGGLGSDVLTGGVGGDFFNFQSASDGPDEITDFATGTDQIRVSASDFGGGLAAGGAVSLVSGSDPRANDDATGQFLYDTDDGSLFWDADGTGSGAAVLVATLSNVPPLETSDFIVV
jgi:VCBS repeat-containing protein